MATSDSLTRLARLGASLGPTFTRMLVPQARAEFELERERLREQILLLGGPARIESLLTEADRRAEVMASYWAARTAAPPEPPPLLALRSVFDDLCTGRL
jgi:hypothetical protein